MKRGSIANSSLRRVDHVSENLKTEELEPQTLSHCHFAGLQSINGGRGSAFMIGCRVLAISPSWHSWGRGACPSLWWIDTLKVLLKLKGFTRQTHLALAQRIEKFAFFCALSGVHNDISSLEPVAKIRNGRFVPNRFEEEFCDRTFGIKQTEAGTLVNRFSRRLLQNWYRIMSAKKKELFP